MWRSPSFLLASGFGAGLLPKAPGTWGTLVGVPVFFVLSQHELWWYASFCVALFVAGIWAAEQTMRQLGAHDHPAIVVDEILGYLVTMSVVIDEGGWWWLAGFFLFRLFDVWKPWPVRQVDRKVGGGLGVMLDDVVAGVLAALCLFAWREFVALA